MAYVALNFGTSTLASGINASDTTINVQTGHGVRFAVGSDYSYLVLENTSGNTEIVKITGQTGDALTVVRAQDNTTARSWVSGDAIECRPCAAAIADLQAENAALVTAHTGDTTAAHAASAISYAGSAGMTATDVEGAIDELAGDYSTVSSGLSAHLSDTTDAHDASAISYAGASGMTATDVEGAIDELAARASIPTLSSGDVGKALVVGAGPAAAIGSSVVLGTSQALTSGTSFYWGFPDWANEVTISFKGVNGTPRVRIGTSSASVTTGYVGGLQQITNTAASYTVLATGLSTGSGGPFSGHVTFRRISGNVWGFSGTAAHETANDQGCYKWDGAIDVGATAARVYIEAGSGSFSAGTANTVHS